MVVKLQGIPREMVTMTTMEHGTGKMAELPVP